MEDSHILLAPDIVLNIVALAQSIHGQFIILFVDFPEFFIGLQFLIMLRIDLDPGPVIMPVEENTLEHLGV
jgi:hypothetical protein